ncbi:MAG: hypothetical protein E7617_06135 [Ruminococcaceae bacterium]|nr:hypothetical protein [Oscillospiraceae bacterium]
MSAIIALAVCICIGVIGLSLDSILFALGALNCRGAIAIVFTCSMRSLCLSSYCVTYRTGNCSGAIAIIGIGNVILGELTCTGLPGLKVGNGSGASFILEEVVTAGALIVILPAGSRTGCFLSELLLTVRAGGVTECRSDYVFTNGTLYRIMLGCGISVGSMRLRVS